MGAELPLSQDFFSPRAPDTHTPDDPRMPPARWTAQVALGAAAVALLGDERLRRPVTLANTALTVYALRDVLAPLAGAAALLLVAKPYLVLGAACASLAARADLLALDARIGVAVLGFLFQTLALPDAAAGETAEESAALRRLRARFPYHVIGDTLKANLRVERVHPLRAALLAALVAAYARKLALRRPGPLLALR